MKNNGKAAKTINRLGEEGQDKVTGFRGIVTSVSFDLYGCVSYWLTPKVKQDDDGNQAPTDGGRWFDADRIKFGDDREKVMPVPDFLGERDLHPVKREKHSLHKVLRSQLQI